MNYFFKERKINKEYKGIRNFKFNTWIYFNLDIELKINKETLFLKEFKKVRIKKGQYVDYIGLTDNHKVWSTYPHLQLWLRHKTKKILVFTSLSFIFVISLIDLINNIILNKNDINIITVLVVITSFLTLIIFPFANFLKRQRNIRKIKNFLKEDSQFILKIERKNGKEVSDINGLEGKIKYRRNKIIFVFPRSISYIKNINYFKHNNTFTYLYIQKFNKSCFEPDEISKSGNAIYFVLENKIKYMTSDETQTQGIIELE